jgi:RNA polymerase sigma-70 factor (sigma-E family)
LPGVRTTHRTGEDPISSFESFAASRWPGLVRTCRLLTGDVHDGEDLAQISLVKLYAVWHRVRPDTADAYLRRIAVNAQLSRQRRRRLWIVPQAEPPDRPGPEPEDQLGERSVLLAALADLPDRQRATVVLRCWQDLSEDAVADLLGCSRGTVKSQLSKGLAKLRNHPALAGLAPGRPDDVEPVGGAR